MVHLRFSPCPPDSRGGSAPARAGPCVHRTQTPGAASASAGTPPAGSPGSGASGSGTKDSVGVIILEDGGWLS